MVSPWEHTAFWLAFSYFRRLERRLNQDLHLQKVYHKALQEYIIRHHVVTTMTRWGQSGHATPCHPVKLESSGYDQYLTSLPQMKLGLAVLKLRGHRKFYSNEEIYSRWVRCSRVTRNFNLCYPSRKVSAPACQSVQQRSAAVDSRWRNGVPSSDKKALVRFLSQPFSKWSWKARTKSTH